MGASTLENLKQQSTWLQLSQQTIPSANYLMAKSIYGVDSPHNPLIHMSRQSVTDSHIDVVAN